MKRLNVLASTLAATFALAWPAAASAGFVWTEKAPGAGDVVATAQVTYDSAFNSLDAISGAISNTTGFLEADLYRIRIQDPAAFSATVQGGGLDFALFLFEEAGLGVFMSDDNPVPPDPLLPALPGGFGPGVYYLAVAFALSNPVDASDNSIFDMTGAPVENAAAGAGPLAGWQLNGGFGTSPFSYDILLTGATNSDIPEPATAALLLAGGIAAWVSSRRRKGAAEQPALTAVVA